MSERDPSTRLEEAAEPDSVRDRVLDELDEVDESLLASFPDDPRLDSGVPAGERSDDLDFVEMSGLASAGSGEPAADSGDELDDGHPVSFYEEGVADVDSRLAPGAIHDEEGADEFELAGDDAPPPTMRETLASRARDEAAFAESGIEVPGNESDEDAAGEEEAPEPAEPGPAAGEPEPTADEPQPGGEAALSQDLLDELLTASRDGAAPPHDSAADDEDVLSELENDARFGDSMERESSEESQEGEGAVVLGPDALSGELLDDEEPREAADEPAAGEPGPAPEPVAPGSAEKTPVRETQEPEARSRRVPSLEEAERLLAELQEQPTAEASHPQDMPLPEGPPTAFNLTAKDPAPGTPGAVPDEPAGEDPEAASDGWEPWSPPDVEDRHELPRRRRHRQRRRPISIVRVLLGCVVGAAVLAAGWYGYEEMDNRLGSPSRVYRRAEKLEQRGELREAARSYTQFVQRFPEHPLRSDAQFNAAYLLYAFADRLPPTAAKQALEQARQGLSDFIEKFPAHPRVTRARIVRGMLEYDLGHYREAVNALADESLRVADPLATLPVLRTIGRSYAALNEYDKARAAFLQAANLRDNPQPDKDYAELGDLYYGLALSVDDHAARAEHAHVALQYWEQAMTYPGVPPTAKKELRIKMDSVRDLIEADLEAERKAALDGLSPVPRQDPTPVAAGETEVSDGGAPAAETPAVPAPDAAEPEPPEATGPEPGPAE